jgi:hypothetical protein
MLAAGKNVEGRLPSARSQHSNLPALEEPLRRSQEGRAQETARTGEEERTAQKGSCGSDLGQGDSQGDSGGKMVGPARKREAVKHVQDRLGTSERRACGSLGLPRSTHRYKGRRRRADADLIKAIRRIARREPRAGYRRVAKYLKREGWNVNMDPPALEAGGAQSSSQGAKEALLSRVRIITGNRGS